MPPKRAKNAKAKKAPAKKRASQKPKKPARPPRGPKPSSNKRHSFLSDMEDSMRDTATLMSRLIKASREATGRDDGCHSALPSTVQSLKATAETVSKRNAKRSKRLLSAALRLGSSSSDLSASLPPAEMTKALSEMDESMRETASLMSRLIQTSSDGAEEWKRDQQQSLDALHRPNLPLAAAAASISPNEDAEMVASLNAWVQNNQEPQLQQQHQLPVGALSDLSDDLLLEVCNFFSLKEKARACGLNQRWKRFVTNSIHEVVIGEKRRRDLVLPGLKYVLPSRRENVLGSTKSDSIDSLDIDAAMHFFASLCHHSIRRFSMYVRQWHLPVRNGENKETDTLVRLTHGGLASFFDRCPSLDCVELFFDWCPENEVGKITAEGALDALRRHERLRVFRTQYVVFPYNSLERLLPAWNELQVLDLKNAEMVRRGRRLDVLRHSATLAAIGKLTSLRVLKLKNWWIGDDDLSLFLPALVNLRSLTLGTATDFPPQLLTDAGLNAIAEHSCSLQRLSLHMEGKITSDGLCSVLRRCPLRELKLETAFDCGTGLYSTMIYPRDLKKICSTGETLLHFRSDFICDCCPTCDGSSHVVHQDEFRDAVVASGGRVVLHHTQTFSAIELSPPVEGESLEERKRSFRKIYSANRRKSGLIHDRWDRQHEGSSRQTKGTSYLFGSLDESSMPSDSECFIPMFNFDEGEGMDTVAEDFSL